MGKGETCPDTCYATKSGGSHITTTTATPTPRRARRSCICALEYALSRAHTHTHLIDDAIQCIIDAMLHTIRRLYIYLYAGVPVCCSQHPQALIIKTVLLTHVESIILHKTDNRTARTHTHMRICGRLHRSHRRPAARLPDALVVTCRWQTTAAQTQCINTHTRTQVYTCDRFAAQARSGLRTCAHERTYFYTHVCVRVRV